MTQSATPEPAMVLLENSMCTCERERVNEADNTLALLGNSWGPSDCPEGLRGLLGFPGHTLRTADLKEHFEKNPLSICE